MSSGASVTVSLPGRAGLPRQAAYRATPRCATLPGPACAGHAQSIQVHQPPLFSFARLPPLFACVRALHRQPAPVFATYLPPSHFVAPFLHSRFLPLSAILAGLFCRYCYCFVALPSIAAVYAFRPAISSASIWLPASSARAHSAPASDGIAPGFHAGHAVRSRAWSASPASPSPPLRIRIRRIVSRFSLFVARSHFHARHSHSLCAHFFRISRLPGRSSSVVGSTLRIFFSITTSLSAQAPISARPPHHSILPAAHARHTRNAVRGQARRFLLSPGNAGRRQA